MLRFVKAATVAAVSITLGSAVFFADPGFALGNNQSILLAADMIVIDPATLAADKNTANLAKDGKVTATLANNGDIIFTPGNGGGPVMDAVDEGFENENENPDKLSASSLAELVRVQGAPGSLSAEEQCLAGAVYFESKGESLAGQLAVAHVVIARSKSGRFASTLCGVVYQKSQFSFVRGNSMPPINSGSVHWRNAAAISKIALENSWKSPVEGALFFHARRVSPGWRLTRLGAVDNHIFYR